jgi:hypothetical protein
VGFLSNLFGSKQPAPVCAIHSDDRDLVRQDDIDWWSHLSLKDCQAMEQEDNISRLTAFRKFINADHLPNPEAGEKVRRTFPTYYRTLEQRADEKFALDGADAKLPYILKHRVGRGVKRKVIDKQAVERASSFNALARQLIRAGRL